MCGFLEARLSWKPGSRLTTDEIFPFPPLAKGFWCNCQLDKCKSYLSYSQNPWTDTFLHDISPAKLCSTARLRNAQWISKLMNKVDCWVPCALLKVIVRAFLATKSLAVGSSTYPCHMACVSKSVPRISLSNCCPQQLRSAVDVMHNSRDWSLSVPFSRSSGFSGV
jgi:hypothetical protein